jgi:serine protease AprX
MPDNNPARRQDEAKAPPPFDDHLLDKTVIAIPLLRAIQREGQGLKRRAKGAATAHELHDVIIDLNLRYPGGRAEAGAWTVAAINAAKRELGVEDPRQRTHEFDAHDPEGTSRGRDHQYVFATLAGAVIQKLVSMDAVHAKELATEHATKQEANAQARVIEQRAGSLRFRAIFHIWPDFPVSATITHSIATIKVDAARNSFSALGRGITWAVMDTGIDKGHPHFTELHGNLAVEERFHRDFTVDPAGPGDPLRDDNGHGTHVAGILAGELRTDEKRLELKAVMRHLNEAGDPTAEDVKLEHISGMAPECKLVSLKVLDAKGQGKSRNVIRAIDHVQVINGYGRELLIQGVNISLGYDFDPEWFACGQSPLCVEIDRLAKNGVVVVVAAGNSGYGQLKTESGTIAAGMSLTINDPGNAELAITVGSTHRDMPHRYGVSYFSAKGPTGDGRLKPDLVAPGEKILSCATGTFKQDDAAGQADVLYVEHSGTSMAVPHVSGAIAAFLSVRNEFIGHPEEVKKIFLSSATDLRRERYFQGAGLVDLMRAIQSV